MMGGHIGVTSKVGQGSQFAFEADFGIQEETSRNHAAQDNGGLLRNMNVLIVDDNATNRRVLCDTVRNWGMNAFIADSGQAALDILSNTSDTPIDLILLDYNMPGMDGFAVAQIIRERKDAKATILMLTLFGKPGRRGPLQGELAFPAYLIKPIRQPELMSAILAVRGFDRPAWKT